MNSDAMNDDEMNSDTVTIAMERAVMKATAAANRRIRV